MGAFYANATVRGPKQASIADLLTTLHRKAIISATENGNTVVFDEGWDSQDERQITAIALRLSDKLSCPVLSVLNHDDDLLQYWLHEAGTLLDEYHSCPDYFSLRPNRQTPIGGDATKLCQAFDQRAAPGEVERVLSSGDDIYPLATDRHRALAKALHLPQSCVGAGFEDLDRLLEMPIGFLRSSRL